MNRNAKIDSYNRRCGIFVDVHNMFRTGKENFNVKIDYQNLLPELSANRDIIIAKAYLLIKDQEKSGSFKEAMSKAGYDLMCKDMEFREYKPHFNQKVEAAPKARNTASWDIGIAMDMLTWSSKLDVIILVSGNGVFVDAITRLKSQNIRVEIAGFEGHTSGNLIKAADDFINLKPFDANALPDWLKKFESKNDGLPVDTEEEVGANR